MSSVLHYAHIAIYVTGAIAILCGIGALINEVQHRRYQRGWRR